ncbi:MAG: DNA topoisomerase [Myxococcota bacterium]
MAKQLVITEKPSVARDVASALGGFVDEGEYLESETYVVTWALGHLLELAEPQDYDKEWKSWSIKNLPIIPDSFQSRPRDGQKKRLDLIKKLGKRQDVDGIINACDAGREGEMIYRRIAEYAGLDQKPERRLWMQSMTTSAIQAAFDALRPGSEFDALADAAWLRGVGDWLIGMNATRALTQRLKSGGERRAWSAGRVQTPTLKLLVDREREILAHEPRDYWEVSATFTYAGNSWVGRWVDPDHSSSDDRDIKPTRIFDRERALQVLAAVQAAESAPAREKRRRSVQKPPTLFDLTTLQREANKRFGLSAKRTLDAAQRLYEGHKVLTYPRTDARTLPDDYGPTVLQVLDAIGGLDLQVEGVPDIAQRILRDGPQNLERVLDSKGVSDHFAIVPTGTAPTEELTGDDARVFELVVRQFLAALMGPATWAVVERFVDVPGEKGAEMFRTNAKSLEIAGFMEALGTEEGSGTHLPPLVPGEDTAEGVPVAVSDPIEEAKQTRPPPRFNEAQLLRMMETAGDEIEDEDLSEAMRGRGIGTPATRASIIEELVRKGYTRRVEKRMAPTSKAMRLMDILDRVNVPRLASPKLTGEWEHALAQVESGDVDRETMLADLVDYTRKVVECLVTFEHQSLYDGSEPLGKCPECGSPVSESAWGYACGRNTGRDSECSFIIWKDRGGRYMDRRTVRELLDKRKLPDVEGFVSLSGQSQTATMSLVKRTVAVKRGKEMVEEERWVVDLDYGNSPGVESEEPEVEENILIPSDDKDAEIVVTNKRYCSRSMFEGTRKIGPILPRIVCHREMSEEEALAFFSEEGKTAILEGFISKRGRPFKGALFRKTTGKHGFEFPPRERKAPAKKPAKSAAKGTKAAAAKSTAKKAPAKKAPAKSAAKKAPAKKSTAKAAKTADGAEVEAAPKKAPAKKAPAKKAPAKKAPAKSTAAKASGRKAPAKKAKADGAEATP